LNPKFPEVKQNTQKLISCANITKLTKKYNKLNYFSFAQWFPHRVGLVSGLITAGFGSGAFIISPVQTKFINPHNLNVDENG
jgi:hypothetical protein